jgi:hypothetical protein
METIVKDLGKLKAMQRAGFIELNEDTGKYVEYQGRKIKVWYVQDGNNHFSFKDKNYETKYYSGTFYPYVVEVN